MADQTNPSGSKGTSNRDGQLERDRQPQTGEEAERAHDPADLRNQAKDSGANPDAGRHSDTKDADARKNPKSTQARGVSHAARGSTRPK
jgi:hypothetical protein